jgi:acetyl esterase/lipase
MVICPGGGYGGLVKGPEGHEMAEWLNQNGITGVVLEYRLPGGNPLIPLVDVQRAIRLCRSSASKWGCDPRRIGVMGFSAGGHLASMAATHYNQDVEGTGDEPGRVSSRPDFAVLIYPVITMGPKTHEGSRNNLLGPHPGDDLVNWYSSEKQVNGETPPSFLAHAQDDSMVSPDNSLMFYDALQSHRIPSSYVRLPYGEHGLNGYSGPMWEEWKEKCLNWMEDMKFIPNRGKR